MISLAKRPLSDQTTNFREINSLCTISHTYLFGTQKHVNGIMFTGFTKNSIIKYIGCTIVVGINCSNNLKDICHKRCMVCVVGINYNNKLKDMWLKCYSTKVYFEVFSFMGNYTLILKLLYRKKNKILFPSILTVEILTRNTS